MAAIKGKGSAGVALVRILRILELLPYPPAEGLTVAQICSQLRMRKEYSDHKLSDGALKKAVQRDLSGLRKIEDSENLESDEDTKTTTKKPNISEELLEFDVGLEVNKGKWRHLNGTKPMPLKNLPEEQKLILAMSERYLRQFLPQEMYKEMAPMFGRALGLSGSQANKIKPYLDSIGWVVPGVTRYPPRDLHPDNLRRISEALFNQYQLKFCYLKPDANEPTEYRLHPIGLIQRGYRYILVGIKHSDYEKHHEAVRAGQVDLPLISFTRQFISNRFVGSIDVLDHQGEARGNNLPRLDDVLKAGVLNFTQGYSKKKEILKLRFSKNQIGERFEAQFKEQPISLDQKIYINNGFTELTATVIESIELQWMLQGMASGVKVIEGSDTLKERIKQFAQAAYELQYGE